MGSLTSITKFGTPERTKKGVAFDLEVPIVDFNRNKSASLFLREGKPPLVAYLGLKRDERTVPNRISFDVSVPVNGTLEDFVSRNILPPFREFFRSEGINLSSIILEVTHIIELASLALTSPQRSWSVRPKLRGSITKRPFSIKYPSGGGYSRNSRSPYLLMEREGEYRFGHINDDHIYKDAGHPAILSKNPGFEERGGGEILLTGGVLSLFSSSSNFGQPPLELLKDTAAAVVASLRGRIRVSSVLLEGTVEHEFAL